MIETDRLVSPDSSAAMPDDRVERALRPGRLDEYVGQEKIRGQLTVFIQAAVGRQEPLDHVLLFGPPGLGKTTFSAYYRSRNGRERPSNLRACDREGGRSCCFADQPRVQ